MLNPIDTNQTLSLSSLVKFTWGRNSARYAMWTAPIEFAGETYEALPSMSIDYNEQHGGSKDAPINIVVPDTVFPISAMLFRKWIPISVEVYEVDALNPNTNSRPRFKGRILSTTAAKGQNGRTVTVKVEGIKSAFSMSLGIIVANECQWSFGDRICRKDLTLLTETATISQVEDSLLSISGLSARPDLFWNRGVVTVDGYSIGIRSWTSGTVFNMFRIPPAAWLGQTCSVQAGCDKTAANCKDKWNNISRFGAIGTKCLAYNPQTQVP